MKFNVNDAVYPISCTFPTSEVILPDSLTVSSYVFSTANAQKYLNKRYTRDDKSIVLVGVYGSYFNSFSKKLKSIVGRLSFQQTL